MFFPLPCTNRQLSGGKAHAYLFPSLCLLGYTNKNKVHCQEFKGKYLCNLSKKNPLSEERG